MFIKNSFCATPTLVKPLISWPKSAMKQDKKTSELIKLGMAIGINSEGAIRSHTRRAMREGISTDEIRHVVLLAFTTCGFPHTIAAFKWVEEVLDKAEIKLENEK
jgi:4-carboxymuconolactone decarboxylase